MAAASGKKIALLNAPRTVIGYHGCSREVAERILNDGIFLPSTKTYDWLGEGVYFWEYAPYRALEWAKDKCGMNGGEPAVIRATIKLRRCLNLLDIEHIPGLVNIYNSIVASQVDKRLPRNTESGAHFLDRQIIDIYCRTAENKTIDNIKTVRGSFAEGEPIYPGSKILHKAHTQIAVRNQDCIIRTSLVQFIR